VDCIIIIGHNLFLTPLTRPVLLGDAQILASPLGSKVLSLTLVQLVMLPMMYGVYRQLPLRCIRSVGRTQLILLVTVAGCSMYLNSMLRLITDNRIPTGVELSVFSIILQFALLLCLVLMEQSQYNLRSHAAAQMQLSRVQATLERARRDHQADERIRKIHHDLNNHMSSLQYLIGDGEYDKAAQYIERFRSTIPVKEAAIHTGNTMLDSLLREKAAQAEGIGAEVMITADLTGLGAISDFDLCTIFGNILDNAIEACSQVTQPRGRYIHLRSAAYAGYTVITLSNSYEGERLRAPFSFKTTKADAENHGYGLANVRAALDKYGGVLSAKAHQHKQQFALSIMIPQEIEE